MPKARFTLAASLAALLALTSCSSPATQELDSTVGVQLFMWNWDSVAKECTEVLGPAGVDWVLVSPPQEHIVGDQWWIHYQPVSYQIESALGNQEQFRAMNAACADAGVDVIADAVINHMTAQESGVGFAGTAFSKYEYPGLYSIGSFHNCGLTTDGRISNYSNKEEVQTCELLGLSDLNTSIPNVQQRILGYLLALIDLGVDGFRIDAAKHMAAEDIKAITDQLPDGIQVIQEVIRGGNEPIQPEDYLESGMVWEFNYLRNLRTMFIKKRVTFDSTMERLMGYSPSEKTVTFVSNHDTERNRQAIDYRRAEEFAMATAFMLADEYGQPMLYSGYSFDSYDKAPNSQGGKISDVTCVSSEGPQEDYEDNLWLCQHRWPSTLAMIKFRDQVGTAKTIDLLNQNGLIAFEREGKGVFIVALRKPTEPELELQVGLPDGKYCNVYLSSSSDSCSEIVEVNGGVLRTDISPGDVVAIHLGAKG